VPKIRENFYFDEIYAIILFKRQFAENFPALSLTLSFNCGGRGCHMIPAETGSTPPFWRILK
jgi:hypothetical protein